MSRRVVLTCLAVLIVIWTFKLRGPDIRISRDFLRYSNTPQQTWNNLTYLTNGISLSPNFTYTQRIIKTTHFDGDRPEMTTVDGTLFPDPQMLDRDSLSNVEFTRLPPLTLQVPSTPILDTGTLSFGIATSVFRLKMAFDQLSLWLPGSGCPLHIVNPVASPPETEPSILPEVLELYANNDINLTVTASDLIFPIAYFSLLKVLYESRMPHTKVSWSFPFSSLVLTFFKVACPDRR